MKTFYKQPLIFKTNNENSYLLNFKKKQSLYLHPILEKLARIYINSDFKEVERYKSSLEKSHKKNETEYYFRKFNFLLQKGFFEKHKIEITPITKTKIKQSVSNVKHIVFEVTEKCNLKCKYCGYGDLYFQSQSKNKDKDFSIEKAKNLIDHIINETIDKPTPLISMSFYGGEPLLKFDFIKEVVDYSKTNWPIQSFEYRMTTNAVLLNKYMNYLVENNFYLLLSLDGNEKHNKYRTFKNGKDSYNSVFKNIHLLKNKYPDYFENMIEFNAVINSESNTKDVGDYFLKEFEKTPQFTQELSHVGFNPDKKDDFKKISNNYVSNVKDSPYYIRKKFSENYKDFNELKEKNKSNQKQYFLNHPSSTCFPFEIKIFITASGKVRNCEKIGMSLPVDDFSHNKIKFDYNRITERFKLFQRNANKICNSCYKYDCSECILVHTDQDGNFKCSSFVTKEMAAKQMSKQFSKVENNPHLVTEEPLVK